MRVSILQVIHCDSGHDIRPFGAVAIDREIAFLLSEAKTERRGHEERWKEGWRALIEGMMECDLWLDASLS